MPLLAANPINAYEEKRMRQKSALAIFKLIISILISLFICVNTAFAAGAYTNLDSYYKYKALHTELSTTLSTIAAKQDAGQFVDWSAVSQQYGLPPNMQSTEIQSRLNQLYADIATVINPIDDAGIALAEAYAPGDPVKGAAYCTTGAFGSSGARHIDGLSESDYDKLAVDFYNLDLTSDAILNAPPTLAVVPELNAPSTPARYRTARP